MSESFVTFASSATARVHDERMRLIHRAYDYVAKGKDRDNWLLLASRIGFSQAIAEEAWASARGAFDAGIGKLDAFPTVSMLLQSDGSSVEIATGIESVPYSSSILCLPAPSPESLGRSSGIQSEEIDLNDIDMTPEEVAFQAMERVEVPTISLESGLPDEVQVSEVITDDVDWSMGN